jgi:alkylhydroperoxidase/carboxymuconolactone decarboxylase family protein YurZ
MNLEDLPSVVQTLARKYPDVWSTYNRLGETVAQAGPFDAKTERLLKLAIAVGAGLHGAVHSHARRGLAAGLTREEMQHVALLAITTVGWPSAVAAFSWLEEVFESSGDAQPRD